MTGLDPQLLQEMVGQQPRLDRPARRTKRVPFRSSTVRMVECGCVMNAVTRFTSISHRHRLTGIAQAPLNFDVGQRPVPGQIHFLCGQTPRPGHQLEYRTQSRSSPCC